jgi:hypothetical protein
MTACMSHRLGLRTAVLSPLLFCACSDDGIKVPDPEVKKTDVKLDIPKPPGFELPPSPGEGFHTVKQLRVNGKKVLETEVKVKGFITWAYDCKLAVQVPGEKPEDVQARIDKDPTICERAKFYVGDTKETPAEKSIWVVDVPRPYNKKELDNIKKKDRNEPNKCEPDDMKKDPKKVICPPYAVGDEVEIVGSRKLSSPHSERNSEGLIVYQKMKNVTQGWETPAGAEAGTGPTGATKPSPTDIAKRPGG